LLVHEYNSIKQGDAETGTDPKLTPTQKKDQELRTPLLSGAKVRLGLGRRITSYASSGINRVTGGHLFITLILASQ
jgi:hypothetical protein